MLSAGGRAVGPPRHVPATPALSAVKYGGKSASAVGRRVQCAPDVMDLVSTLRAA